MADPSSDDLDQLLDSALDDFGKLDLGSSQRGNYGSGEMPSSSSSTSSIATPSTVHGLGMGLPDLNGKKKKKGKQKEAMKDSHLSEALDKLTQQTREAVRGLESTTAAAAAASQNDLGKDGMMEDFVKQFEELAGSHDMESIVETMMQQLLSKEILHEPMKEIGERYPIWLEEHKAKLSNEEYDRYCHQYELIKQLNVVYENDSGNFTKIVELMQKMQECGQPPNDIVRELAPDLDLTNLGGQLPPELLESTSNCCIM